MLSAANSVVAHLLTYVYDLSCKIDDDSNPFSLSLPPLFILLFSRKDRGGDVSVDRAVALLACSEEASNREFEKEFSFFIRPVLGSK